jgi:hypothetical protein
VLPTTQKSVLAKTNGSCTNQLALVVKERAEVALGLLDKDRQRVPDGDNRHRPAGKVRDDQPVNVQADEHADDVLGSGDTWGDHRRRQISGAA